MFRTSTSDVARAFDAYNDHREKIAESRYTKVMAKLKKHLKLKGKPVCGVRQQKSKLQFVADKSELTCSRCLKAVER